MSSRRQGLLVLADGTRFEGEYLGADIAEPISGEVVFHTAMSGYQEVLTDPSYAGQIVSFTYPHIGNYGISTDASESKMTAVRGMIARDVSQTASNWSSEQTLPEFLAERNLGCLSGVDTRKLTKQIRDTGAMPGAFGPLDAFDEQTLVGAAETELGTDGVDLVAQVTTKEPYVVGSGERNIVALDFGIKQSILDQLAELGTVTVLPASTTAAEVLARNPNGVFLSNGPGDPTVVTYAIDTVRDLVGKVPIFGICLGHQLLSLAIGAEVIKLDFGHHGANHPVMNMGNSEVEITSQNHNFAVDPATLGEGVEVTHINLNDQVCQGIAIPAKHAFSVQHHPEANPGPNDSTYLFTEFRELMDNYAKKN